MFSRVKAVHMYYLNAVTTTTLSVLSPYCIRGAEAESKHTSWWDKPCSLKDYNNYKNIRSTLMIQAKDPASQAFCNSPTMTPQMSLGAPRYMYPVACPLYLAFRDRQTQAWRLHVVIMACFLWRYFPHKSVQFPFKDTWANWHNILCLEVPWSL